MVRSIGFWLLLLLGGNTCQCLSSSSSTSSSHRRTLLTSAACAVIPSWLSSPTPAQAVADCFTDCFQNCRTIAPKNLDYCQSSCKDYCDQPDRQDGLSGSVSSANGEVGILGGGFGQGTVPKGQDKPPSLNLPGLDFSSGLGRKLIGYD